MFQGSITALITPFRNGAVDEKAFQEFVDWQIKEGTDGAGARRHHRRIARPSRHDEHKRVVELCIEVAGKRVPVIAGTGSNSTDEAIEPHRATPSRPAPMRRWSCCPTTTSRRRKGSIALQGDPRRGRHPDHHLQHAAAHRRRHDASRPWRGCAKLPQHRRRQGRDRRPGAAACTRASPSARISASSPARTARRCRSWRRAAMAASRSPPMSRRGSAPSMHEAWQKARPRRRRCRSTSG